MLEIVNTCTQIYKRHSEVMLRDYRQVIRLDGEECRFHLDPLPSQKSFEIIIKNFVLYYNYRRKEIAFKFYNDGKWGYGTWSYYLVFNCLGMLLVGSYEPSYTYIVINALNRPEYQILLKFLNMLKYDRIKILDPYFNTNKRYYI